LLLYDGLPTAGLEPARRLDPAAWGGDHVGQPVPEFTAGDECLFCHRNDVGPSWNDNRHNRSVREVVPDAPGLAALLKTPELKALAAEASLVMGEDRRQRFLRPAAGAFGTLEMLSVAWEPARGERPGKLLDLERPHWDQKSFGDSCAGCHATGVDSQQRRFMTRSLDCGVCHGEVPNEHTKDRALVFLSPKRKDPARVTISLCAQCHARGGTSRSTALPYPNNFVAGDNLFRDFQVDLSDEAIARQNPADAHVLQNIRDVVVLGEERVTCVTCHDVHKQTAKKHHLVPQASTSTCLACHHATGSKKERTPYEVHNRTCGY
jgi:hypothetical protein